MLPTQKIQHEKNVAATALTIKIATYFSKTLSLINIYQEHTKFEACPSNTIGDLT